MSICKVCNGMGQHEIEGFSFPYRTQIVDCLDCDGDGSDPRWVEKMSLDELVEHLGEEESDELREEAARRLIKYHKAEQIVSGQLMELEARNKVMEEALRKIRDQGGDVVEKWSSQVAEQALLVAP